MEYSVRKDAVFVIYPDLTFFVVFAIDLIKKISVGGHTHMHTHTLKCDRCVGLAPHLASVDPVYPVLWLNLVGFIVSLLMRDWAF